MVTAKLETRVPAAQHQQRLLVQLGRHEGGSRSVGGGGAGPQSRGRSAKSFGMLSRANGNPKGQVPGCGKEETMIEERETASWRYQHDVLYAMNASQCYYAAMLGLSYIT